MIYSPPSERGPSLHAFRRRSSQACSGVSQVLLPRPTPHPFLDGFASSASRRGPEPLAAAVGGVRPPGFRPDPFVRDVASGPGRATGPCLAVPAQIAFGIIDDLGLCNIAISWLNPTPHTIAVYASSWPSPNTTQHSLPGRRYPLPEPDFHRLDHASFPGAPMVARPAARAPVVNWRQLSCPLAAWSRRTCILSLAWVISAAPSRRSSVVPRPSRCSQDPTVTSSPVATPRKRHVPAARKVLAVPNVSSRNWR